MPVIVQADGFLTIVLEKLASSKIASSFSRLSRVEGFNFKTACMECPSVLLDIKIYADVYWTKQAVVTVKQGNTVLIYVYVY